MTPASGEPTAPAYGASKDVLTDNDWKVRDGQVIIFESWGTYSNYAFDVSRTVHVGEPTAEMKDRFTRVLRGHIGIATAAGADFNRHPLLHRPPAAARGFGEPIVWHGELWFGVALADRAPGRDLPRGAPFNPCGDEFA